MTAYRLKLYTDHALWFAGCFVFPLALYVLGVSGA